MSENKNKINKNQKKRIKELIGNKNNENVEKINERRGSLNEEAWIKNIAERIYDLDAMVYEIIGSHLGRVYNGEKERNVLYIANMIAKKDQDTVLREELALIGNMAKSIKDEALYSEYDIKFREIIFDLRDYFVDPTNSNVIDIRRSKMDQLPVHERYAKMEHKIICISRTFGSAGSEIGFALAGELGVNYYDNEIFNEVAKRLEVSNKRATDEGSLYSKNEDGRPVYTGTAFEREGKSLKQMLDDFRRFHGLPRADALFFNQSELIANMAKNEDFVIMGRCADMILTNARIPHISIFVSAPFEQRVKRLKNVYPNMTELKIKAMIRKVDRRRAREYKRFTGGRWAEISNYDMTINSSHYGIDGAVDMILQAFKQKKDK